MFCPNCGKKISEGSKFCEDCGEKTTSLDWEKEVISTNYNVENNKLSEKELLLVNEAKHVAEKMILGGIGWIIAGIVITGITYSMADTGGTYFIFWGLSLYGAYRLIKGLYYRTMPHELIGEFSKEDNLAERKSNKIIGWYNENTDHFICMDCFSKIGDFRQEEYRAVMENNLNKNIYTCDVCKKEF